jgi:light-regulated signal transduction histidine kinase (bacteriophytochrome)
MALRHIVGYAQLLKKSESERLSERGDRYIGTIIESPISAAQLVNGHRACRRQADR